MFRLKVRKSKSVRKFEIGESRIKEQQKDCFFLKEGQYIITGKRGHNSSQKKERTSNFWFPKRRWYKPRYHLEEDIDATIRKAKANKVFCETKARGYIDQTDEFLGCSVRQLKLFKHPLSQY